MRNIFLFFKILVPLALFFYIFRFQAKLIDVFQIMRECHPLYFFAALFLFLLTKFQIAIRLYYLSSSYLQRSCLPILKDLFIANFFSTVLPIGSGEVYRIAMLSKSTRRYIRSAALITLDRFFGFMAIFSINLVAIFFSPQQIQGFDPSLVCIGLIILLPLFLIVGFYLKNKKLSNRFAIEFQFLFTYIYEHPFKSLCGYLFSILIMIILMISIYFLSQGLGLYVEFIDVLRFYPMVILATLLPLSVGGLGIREFAIIAIFGGLLGVPKEDCVSWGLMQYALMLAVAFVGLILFISVESNIIQKK
jgi:glycosyltransferase 2 family protein